MDFSDPPRKPLVENLLPMINVVFLLLIFFLLTARLAPPQPFPVTPPVARGGLDRPGEFTLSLGPDGTFGYRDATGPSVLAMLAADRAAYCAADDCAARPPVLLLRADRTMPAALLARAMPQLGAAGFVRIDLLTELP
jgi:biopolymer transport protein ExbD